jgi:hypothetical protein
VGQAPINESLWAAAPRCRGSGLQQQIAGGVETHLYLTDYRSLYVGHLEEVTAENVPAETDGELEHMPEYYRGRYADFWFRLRDIRRLVADDTEGTIAELRHLRNTRYRDRPVSLYGGMVDLPLIVTRDEETKWFSGAEPLTGGKLWAERDAQLRGETEKMEHELRDNLLGRVIWEALEAASRAFLGSGEAVFRARRSDPGFDFSGPALEYAKTVETELNVLIFPALHRWLKGKKPAERETRVNGVPLDLGRPVSHQTLGAIRLLLVKDEIVRRTLPIALQHDAKWLLGELPPRLESLTNLRNPAAHAGEFSLDAATRLRDEVLGVGCEGVLVRIARAKLRARP